MKPLCLLAVLLFAVQSRAQDPVAISQDNANLARTGVFCFIMPGGTYFVRLSTITSASVHEYVVDGAATVTELTMASQSSEVARFYYLEPITPQSPVGVGQSLIDKAQEHVEEGIQRTGQSAILHKVIKNYPATTHAHTIEYRVEKKGDIDLIYGAFLNRWIEGQGLYYYKLP